jgi:hypothetical protein
MGYGEDLYFIFTRSVGGGGIDIEVGHTTMHRMEVRDLFYSDVAPDRRGWRCWGGTFVIRSGYRNIEMDTETLRWARVHTCAL